MGVEAENNIKSVEQISTTTTTTYGEAPPPYTPTAATTSAGYNNTVITNTVADAPPPYTSIHSSGNGKKQVITVTHVPVPPPTVRVIQLQSFGPDPAVVRCPSCGYAGESKIHREGGTMMWAWVCVLFWFIAWPCSWIPCVMDDCKDVHHECPQCGYHLGQMTRC